MHDKPGNEYFERTGFTIIPDAVGRDTFCGLITAIEQGDAKADSRRRKTTQYAIRNLLSVPAVKVLAESAPIRALVENVLGPEAVAVRGLLFDKTPGANWKVAWHQDLTVAVKQRREVPDYGPWSIKSGVPHVQPPAAVLEKMLTLRLHLDDCAATNGPLQVLPGSHRAGKLSAENIECWRKKVLAVDCLVKSGGVLLMRPLLLHASSKATQPGHRRVIHLEFAVVELEGGLEWVS